MGSIREQAWQQLETFCDSAVLSYAKMRNYDYSPGQHHNVSRLSHYIRNRVLTEKEVVQAVLKKHAYHRVEKFIQEVLWRTYWKGWLEMRPTLWDRYCADCQHLVDNGGHSPQYRAAKQGKTGICCFDTWVHELVDTGYLHNHTRMWFASIWIFTLGLPWQLGAHFFMRHLLDGDPASNTLSWRWVAGLHTRGKYYIARESNIAKFTQGRFASKGKLNTTAAPLTESEPLPKPVWIRQEKEPLPKGRPFGIIVTDEDVAIPNPWTECATSILGIIPKDAYQRHGLSDSVFEHRAACLQESLISWADALRKTYTLVKEDYIQQTVQWAVAADLKYVVMIKPTVGIWNGVTPGLKAALDAVDVQLLTQRKLWDESLFPYATKGFFSFKRIIPSFLKKLQNEQEALTS